MFFIDYDEDDEEIKTVFNDEEEETQEVNKKIINKKVKKQFIANPTLIEEATNNLEPLPIANEMEKSFLEYAMSVIVSRALPDVRDGLKPVHRRILYAMNELGLHSSSSHKKSVRVVGDVLGKYHPHGDASIYEAMVRMAQDFSMRYPLVNGQGNFGSIDGDSAAAMRYTEAKMTKLSSKMVEDIKKNTVNFVPNYDGSDLEPEVLPSRFPNMLISGAVGIAVGMATSIPPHNLTEVIDGLIAYAKNPDISIDEICEYIKAPDFPTGGILIGTHNSKKAYETGKGSILIRSKTHFEILKNGKERIIVTEIPYMVNKSRLIEKIAILVKNKIIEGISDLRDESSKEGIRIVIVLKRGVIASVVLNKLFKATSLESSFSMNMIALDKNVPKVLNLKQILRSYLDHQKEVVLRRTQFDYDKAAKRAHILEGLKIAIQNIDAIIKTIKSSKNDVDAQQNIIKQFDLSEIQAKAITDMRLGRLTGLAIEKMIIELKDLELLMESLSKILNDKDFLLETIINELEEVKERFGDERRSVINNELGLITNEDLIPQKDVVIILTTDGYVKRISIDNYTLQKRGGQGSKTANTYESDAIHKIITTNTHKDLFIFTNLGRVYRIRAYEIPEHSKQSKGTYFINIIKLMKNEKVIELLSVDSYEDNISLITISKKGILKRSKISHYKRINKNGKIALSLKENDELFGAMIISDEEKIFIASNDGKLVNFDSTQIKNIGRTASGVKAIKLEEKGQVIGFSKTSHGKLVFAIGKKGFGKLTDTSIYRTTKRNAKGVKTIDAKKAGKLIFIKLVDLDEEFLIITSNGKAIRSKIKDISITKARGTKGVKIVSLKDKTIIKSITIIPKIDVEVENISEEES